MRFWEAMKALEEGEAITPKSHPFPINKESLSKDMECQALTYWNDEWELYEEPEKQLTFAEVVKGLKEGKRFKRKGWHSDIYLNARESTTRVILENSSYHTLVIEDFEATDWVEVQ